MVTLVRTNRLEAYLYVRLKFIYVPMYCAWIYCTKVGNWITFKLYLCELKEFAISKRIQYTQV